MFNIYRYCILRQKCFKILSNCKLTTLLTCLFWDCSLHNLQFAEAVGAAAYAKTSVVSSLKEMRSFGFTGSIRKVHSNKKN